MDASSFDPEPLCSQTTLSSGSTFVLGKNLKMNCSESRFLNMCYITLLSLNILNFSLQVIGLVICLLYDRHEKRGVGEQVIHFLEWAFGSFWKNGPEEYSVCQVTNLTSLPAKVMTLMVWAADLR